MSSRQLRKLQQQRQLELEQARANTVVAPDVEGEGEDESDEQILQSKVKPSLFANLPDLQDASDDAPDADDKSDQISSEEEVVKLTAKRPKTTKMKKKKKAKAKKSLVGVAKVGPELHHRSDDDIDAALRELNIKAANNNSTKREALKFTDKEYERVCKLLGINSQHLKVANEMRNLFGRIAVENHDDTAGIVPGRRGGRRQRMPQQVDLETALKGHHLPGRGLPELTMRRNIFIQGKDEWPRATTGGLTMEVTNDEGDGVIEFRYVHDQAYNNVQQNFDVCVEMGDPQNLIGLLQRYPYHVSLLLQVSKVAKDQSDHSLCNDLVERALFTFARASLSNFATKLAAGKARLDFARPENRELWLGGYQYIKSLVMKGTYRTAFEWAKLLLSLDPEDDPYCMSLTIHHLALRCSEYDWLLEFSETDLYKTSKYTAYTAPSLAYAAMQMKQPAKCRQLLRQSITALPWVFCKLFQELNLSDPPSSIWGQVPPTEATELLTNIYIKQTRDLWNAPEALTLLMEVAHATPKASSSSSWSDREFIIDLDLARFVYLDNTPHLMALVPKSLLHRQPNSDSDPLPPDKEKNLFSWPSQVRPYERNMAHDSSHLTFNNPVDALRALLPRVGHGERQMPENEDELRTELNEGFTSEQVDAIISGMSPARENAGPQGFAARAFTALISAVMGPLRPHDMRPSSDSEGESQDEYYDVEDELGDDRT